MSYVLFCEKHCARLKWCSQTDEETAPPSPKRIRTQSARSDPNAPGIPCSSPSPPSPRPRTVHKDGVPKLDRSKSDGRTTPTSPELIEEQEQEGDQGDNDADVLASTQAPVFSQIAAWASQKDPLVSNLRRGYHHFVDAILDAEQSKNRQPLQGLSRARWRTATIEIVAAIPECILRHLVMGDLAVVYLKKTDKDVVNVMNVYKAMTKQKDPPPGIYQLTLLRPNGDAPTPRQVQTALIDGWIRYRQDGKFASEVDRIAKPSHGHVPGQNYVRHFLSERPTKDALGAGLPVFENPKRITDGDIFFLALKRWVDAVPIAKWDIPMSLLLHYIGWSINMDKRFMAHASHDPQRSNWLLGLCITLLGRFFPFLDFREIALPAIWCFRESHGFVAEVLGAGISKSYSRDGTGFNIDDTGKSNSSSLNLTTEKRGILANWALNKTPLVQNLDDQIALLRQELADVISCEGKDAQSTRDPAVREALITHQEATINSRLNTVDSYLRQAIPLPAKAGELEAQSEQSLEDLERQQRLSLVAKSAILGHMIEVLPDLPDL